jgi:hypothetical protein
MRLAVYALCALYALLFGLAWLNTAAHPIDPAGNAMAEGFLVIGMTVTLLFALPALGLALLGVGRALRVALVLALVPPVLLLLLALGTM